MGQQTVTVNLSDSLFQQAKKTAGVTSLSLEEVLEQSIALSLSRLVEDLPAESDDDLSALELLSDEALWQTARSQLEEDKQIRLEELIEARKMHALSEAEEQEFELLFAEGQWIMLKKAESYRLLTRRGFTIPWING